jgi:hypothetical protein
VLACHSSTVGVPRTSRRTRARRRTSPTTEFVSASRTPSPAAAAAIAAAPLVKAAGRAERDVRPAMLKQVGERGAGDLLDRDLTERRACSASPRISVAGAASRRPPGVRAIPRPARTNSSSPCSLRSAATATETAGSVTSSSAAAALTEPRRATSTKEWS